MQIPSLKADTAVRFAEPAQIVVQFSASSIIPGGAEGDNATNGELDHTRPGHDRPCVFPKLSEASRSHLRPSNSEVRLILDAKAPAFPLRMFFPLVEICPINLHDG
jgi:hypothetical protein